MSVFIRPDPYLPWAGAAEETLEHVRESPQKRLGRPWARLSVHTCDSWLDPAEGDMEEGRSILDLCMRF